MQSLFLLAVYTFACIEVGSIASRAIARLQCGGSLGVSQKIKPVISLQFAFGSALLSTLWLLVSLGGQLRSGVVWAILLFLSMLAARRLSQGGLLAPKTGIKLGLLAVRTNPVFSMLMLLAVTISLWLGVLAYLRPPFGDADAFYMVYPKIIAATGELSAMAGGYRDFSTIGLSGELHFAALMVIGTPATAKLFAWIAGIGMLLLLKDITRHLGGGMIAQGLAIVMLITSSTFSDYLSDGKTDLFAALIGLAAILSLLLARKSPLAKTYMTIAGLLAGFAATAKFSFVVALLPAMMLLAIMQVVDWNSYSSPVDHFKRLTRALTILGVGILIACLPHLLKNQVLFEHALAPFFGMQSNWATTRPWYLSSDTLWIVVTYPAALVFGLYPLMGGNISFLWLAAIPLVLLIPRSNWSLRNPLMQMTVSAGAGLVCWLAIEPSVFAPRYILPILVMLMPLPAIAAEYLWKNESRPRLMSQGYSGLVAVALLALPFSAPAGVWTALPKKIVDYIKSGRSECGLAISSYCEGLNTLNAKTSEGERVFVAGYYTYWLRPDLLQCINEANEAKVFNHATASEVWSALYQNGFSHVAVQKASHGQYLKMLDPNKAPPWLKVSSEFGDSDMPIFHLESRDPTWSSRIVCSRKGRSSWGVAK